MQSLDGAGNVLRDVLGVTSGHDYYLAVVFNGPIADIYLKDLTDGADFEGVQVMGMAGLPHDSSAPFSIGATATFTGNSS